MIMKNKEYIKPELLVVAVKTTGMLASSPVGNDIYDVDATGNALSRRGRFRGDDYLWEYEDDEFNFE